MGLLDEVKERAASGPNRKTCSVALLLPRLSDDDRADLLALLAEKTDYAYIAERLKVRGHTITAFTLSRHARGLCACG